MAWLTSRWVLLWLVGSVLVGSVLAGCAARGPAAEAADPSAKDPSAKDPSAKDPGARDPVAEDPRAKDPVAENPGAVPADAPAEPTLAGRFHIVWNDKPHYYLVQPDGDSAELLLDERLVAPFGGALALNGQWVRVIGVLVSETPRRIRVKSLRVGEEGP